MFFVIISFFFGAIFILLIEYYGLIKIIKSFSPSKISYYGEYIKYKLPQGILSSITNYSHYPQSSLAINLILQFLFKELKDTDRVKKWIVNKIHVELHDLTTTSTLGKVLGEIRVRDVNLGNYFPIINDLTILNVHLSPSQDYIKELDLVMELEYVTNEKLTARASKTSVEEPETGQDTTDPLIDYYGLLIGMINSTLSGMGNETGSQHTTTNNHTTNTYINSNNVLGTLSTSPNTPTSPDTCQNGPAGVKTTNSGPDRSSNPQVDDASTNNPQPQKAGNSDKGFKLILDADLMFGRSAQLAIGLVKLKGPIRLRFTRIPYTHWSFTFMKDPELKLDVDCILKNKHLPHVAAIIASQIKKAVRRKHTYPHYKVRLKPFFQPQTASPPLPKDPSPEMAQSPPLEMEVKQQTETQLNKNQGPGAYNVPNTSGGKLAFLSSAVRKTKLIRRGVHQTPVSTSPLMEPDGPRFFETDTCVVTQKYKMMGKLTIGLLECSRLVPNVPKGSKIYITLSLDDADWETLVNRASKRSRIVNWKRHEKTLIRSPGQTPGFTCKQEFLSERSQVAVVVDNVIPNSPAYLMDIRKGDVIISLNHIVPLTVRQANKIINQSDAKLTIVLERYITMGLEQSKPEALAAYEDPLSHPTFKVKIQPPSPMTSFGNGISPTLDHNTTIEPFPNNFSPISTTFAETSSTKKQSLISVSFVHQKSLSHGDLSSLERKSQQFSSAPRPESFDLDPSKYGEKGSMADVNFYINDENGSRETTSPIQNETEMNENVENLNAPKTHKRVKSLPEQQASAIVGTGIDATGGAINKTNPVYPSFMSNWTYMCTVPNRYALEKGDSKSVARTQTLSYDTSLTWHESYDYYLLAPTAASQAIKDEDPNNDEQATDEPETQPTPPLQTNDEDQCKFRNFYLNLCVWCEVPVDALHLKTGDIAGNRVGMECKDNANSTSFAGTSEDLKKDANNLASLVSSNGKTTSKFILAQLSYEIDPSQLSEHTPLTHGTLFKNVELQPPLNVGLGPPTIFTLTPKLSRFQRLPIDQPPIFDYKKCYGDITISMLFQPRTQEAEDVGESENEIDITLKPDAYGGAPIITDETAFQSWLDTLQVPKTSSSTNDQSTTKSPNHHHYHLLSTIGSRLSPDAAHPLSQLINNPKPRVIQEEIQLQNGSNPNPEPGQGFGPAQRTLKNRATAGGKKLIKSGLDYLYTKQRQLRHRRAYAPSPLQAGSGWPSDSSLDQGLLSDSYVALNESRALEDAAGAGTSACSTSLAPIEEYGSVETGQDVLLEEKLVPIFYASNDYMDSFSPTSYTWSNNNNGTDSETSSLKFSDLGPRSASISSDPSGNRRNHHFVIQQFPKGTLCQYCGKKIWFKVAYICLDCSMICHKKCIGRCQNGTVCIKKSNTTPNFLQTTIDSAETRDEDCPAEIVGVSHGSRHNVKIPPRPPPPKTINLVPDRTDTISLPLNPPQSCGLEERLKIKQASSCQCIAAPLSPQLAPQNKTSYSDDERYTNSKLSIPNQYFDDREESESESHQSESQTDPEFPLPYDREGEEDGSKTLTNHHHGHQERNWDMANTGPKQLAGPQQSQDTLMNEARLLGRQMLLHLPLEERREKLNNMIDNLKREMEEEVESRSEIKEKLEANHDATCSSKDKNGKSYRFRPSASSIKGLTRRKVGATSSKQQLNCNEANILKGALKNCENRLESLSLILIQYCACLEQCIEEEEEKQDKERR